MKKELTDRFLLSLKKNPPEAGRIEVSDTKRPGLRFRLSASGNASWMYEKRVKGGAKRKHTLGSWPTLGLSAARAQALEIEAEAAKGIDRVAMAKAERLEHESARSRALSVGEVIEIYNSLHLSALKRGHERKSQLIQALSSRMDEPMSDLTRGHLQAAIDAKASAGRKTAANRVRAALLAFSKWSWGRNYILVDVGTGIPRATRETVRERVLTLAEIQAIWATTYQMGDLWGPALRLMLLTGQRRGEILSLRWPEIEIDRVRIVKPGSLTKNGKAHITHISPPALTEILAVKEAMEVSGSSPDLLFTTTGTTPISGVSKAKKRLDGFLGSEFTPWRIHDIRTAMATALAESGEPEAIVDRILNHSASGSAPSAVARVYNQSEQLPQRARVLNKWAEMVTGEQAQIVQIEVR